MRRDDDDDEGGVTHELQLDQNTHTHKHTQMTHAVKSDQQLNL